MRLWKSLWILITAAAVVPVVWSAPCNSTLLSRVEAFHRNLRGFEARFEQLQETLDATVTQTARGDLWYQHQGGMRWDYQQPHRQLVVTDGRTVWLHDPLLESVLVRPLAEFTGEAPLVFFMGIGRLRRVFRCISQQYGKDGLTYLRMQARQPIANVQYLEIGVTPQQGKLLAMRLIPTAGESHLLKLHNLKPRTQFPKGSFTFQPPPGTEVIGSPSSTRPGQP